MRIIASDIGTVGASRSPAWTALEAWARRVREIETGEAEGKVVRLGPCAVPGESLSEVVLRIANGMIP
jgi:hypothetical protein